MMLAEKLEYQNYPSYIEKPIAEEKIKTVVKKKSSVNKRMYIFLTLAFFITSLFILNGYATITAMRIEINKLEKERTELIRVRQDLKGELEGLKNSAVISEKASNALGMIYPQEGQVSYVTINDTSYDNSYSISITDRLKSFTSFFSSLY